MSRNAHPHAMKPHKAGRTRTAPPKMPALYPFGGNYRAYTLFDLTGVLYLLAGFVALRVVWSLGNGRAAYESVMQQLSNPLYVLFHLVTLISVVFVGVRFFRLFPKAQLPRIGPAKPPPAPVILGGLYAAWIGVTALFVAILTGGLFG
jgi:fumarate reductase subunit C